MKWTSMFKERLDQRVPIETQYRRVYMSCLRYIVLLFVYVGIACALSYIAIYTRELPQHFRATFSVNTLFSVLIIPTCLAIITNIYSVWDVPIFSIRKWILFVAYIFSILMAISIIHGNLFRVFFVPGNDAIFIAPFVIAFAIAVYFGAYSLVRLILGIFCKI